MDWRAIMAARVVKVGEFDSAEPYPYGDPLTYGLGAQWLAGCALVEDWGCGRGWFSKYLPPVQYRGVDTGVDGVAGQNPHAHALANLEFYSSTVPGIFMRHVLEHNYQWKQILRNAIASFTERMFLVVFTPGLEDEGISDERVIALHGPPEYPFYDPPQPNLSLRVGYIRQEFLDAGAHVGYEQLKTATQYGQEHVWYVAR